MVDQNERRLYENEEDRLNFTWRVIGGAVFAVGVIAIGAIGGERGGHDAGIFAILGLFVHQLLYLIDRRALSRRFRK